MIFNGMNGNIIDNVTLAWQEYVRAGGMLAAYEWHRKHAPTHDPCNLCHD